MSINTQAEDAKKLDLSYYEDHVELIGYPPLADEKDCELIRNRQMTQDELRHHLRMVTWTYSEVTVEQAEATVKKLKANGVNTIISARRQIFSNLGGNIAGSHIVAEACHKQGMKFIQHLTCTDQIHEMVAARYVETHPDQASVDMRTNKPLFSDYNRYATCLNNADFWNAFMMRLEELIKGVPLDGIMLDEIQFLGEYTCGCKTCRDKFKNETGCNLPTNLAGDDKLFFRNLANPIYIKWLDWRKNCITARNLEVRALMKNLRPEGDFYQTYLCEPSVAGENNPYYHTGLQVDAQVDYSHSIGYECEPIHFNHFYGWPAIAPNMKLLKAVNDRINADPWLYFYPTQYGDITWMWILGLTMGNSNFWFPDEENPEELVDRARTPIMQWTAKHHELLGNTTPLADTALVFSHNTRDLCPEGISWRCGYIGTCQAFTDSHLPYRILTDRDLKEDTLAGLKILVLFNTACLSDNALAAITNFVSKGGSLIASGSVSLRDENGKARKDFGFAEMFGFSCKQQIQSEINCLSPKTNDTLDLRSVGQWSLNGPFVELDNLQPDCKVIAEIVGHADQTYPGVIVRSYGKGRVLYFSGHPELKYINVDHMPPNRLPLGQFWKDQRDPKFVETLKAILDYCNPEPAWMLANAPRGVIAEAYRQTVGDLRGMAVHLANFVGSDMREGLVPKIFDVHFPNLKTKRPDPDKEITVGVKADDIRKVFLISPDFPSVIELKKWQDGGYTKVTLPALYRYDLLYFVQKGEKKILDIAGGKAVKELPAPVEMATRSRPCLVGKYDPSHFVFFADCPEDFPQMQGGYFSERGAVGNFFRAVFSAAGSYPSVTTRFKLKQPVSRLEVEIAAMEKGKDGKVPMEIILNDKTVFQGENPFPSADVGVHKFTFDGANVKIGRNKLVLKNTAPTGSDQRPPWIKIQFIKIVPVYP
ncbi:MAG: beta-galactosidase trimerization domain-containing protein [Verrucomicrobia bacterium]|nr:beta-galactosidase trimerization domain-containing protein [Verrucomicrobiota bacterium]